MLGVRTIPPRGELTPVSAPRIPTHIWLEAKIRELSAAGKGVYVVHKGDVTGGMVLVKISGLNGTCRLLTRQRDIDDNLIWINALKTDSPDEKAADDYIRRAISIDPDLWVIECEDRQLQNPFDTSDKRP